MNLTLTHPNRIGGCKSQAAQLSGPLPHQVPVAFSILVAAVDTLYPYSRLSLSSGQVPLRPNPAP